MKKKIIRRKSRKTKSFNWKGFILFITLTVGLGLYFYNSQKRVPDILPVTYSGKAMCQGNAKCEATYDISTAADNAPIYVAEKIADIIIAETKDEVPEPEEQSRRIKEEVENVVEQIEAKEEEEEPACTTNQCKSEFLISAVAPDLTNDQVKETIESLKTYENGHVDERDPVAKPQVKPETNNPAVPPTSDCIQGKFGCPYPPGFVYSGDEPCGGSVAGFYCWGGQRYIINLPATHAAAQTYFAEIKSNIEGSNDVYALLSKQPGATQEEKIKNYLNSIAVYENNPLYDELFLKLKSKTTPQQAAPKSESGQQAPSQQEIADAKQACEAGKGKLLNNMDCVTTQEIQAKRAFCAKNDVTYDADTNSCTSTKSFTRAVVACTAGLQANGSYATCEANGQVKFSFCTGIKDTEWVDGACREKETLKNPKGVFTGGEISKNKGNDCIYGLQKEDPTKCAYAGGKATPPPPVDKVESPASDSGTNTRVVPEKCASYGVNNCGIVCGGTGTYKCDQVGANCTCNNPGSTITVSPITAAGAGSDTGSTDPSVEIYSVNDLKNINSKVCPEGSVPERIAFGGYRCTSIAVVDTTKPFKLYPENLKAGDSCKNGNDNSCSSGNCSLGKKTSTDKAEWLCIPETNSYIEDKDKEYKYGEFPNGFGCEGNNNACASGFCNIKWGWAIIGGKDVCADNPFEDAQSSVPSSSSQSSLNTSSNPGSITSPAVAAVDTGQHSSFNLGPLLTAGPPAANVSGGGAKISSPSFNAPIYSEPPGLTSHGSGDCVRVGNTYCDGERMFELYSWYRDNNGWWNDYGNNELEPAEFLGVMLIVESGGNTELLKSITTASTNQLWGEAAGSREPYCDSQADCQAGVLNFIGAYMESAGRRYNSLLDGKNPEGDSKTWEQYYQHLEDSGLSLEEIADMTVYSQKPKTIDLNAPTEWGSPSLVPNKGPNCEVYFAGGGDIVYSFQQQYNWNNGLCD